MMAVLCLISLIKLIVNYIITCVCFSNEQINNVLSIYRLLCASLMIVSYILAKWWETYHWGPSKHSQVGNKSNQPRDEMETNSRCHMMFFSYNSATTCVTSGTGIASLSGSTWVYPRFLLIGFLIYFFVAFSHCIVNFHMQLLMTTSVSSSFS